MNAPAPASAAKCPLCRAVASSPFQTWPAYAVRQCADCGFRFIDSTASGYPSNAQYIHDEPELGPIRPNLPHIRRRVRDILRFKNPPGKALDVGCGVGELSLALHETGFDCWGMDMKPRSISHLQTRFPHVTWRRATISEMTHAQERFDVITLYHVLEHIQDPLEALASVKALANPGALIAIEVPNAAGWRARLKGRAWDYYKVDHVNYFRPSDLRRLADGCGLSILGEWGYQHFSYPQGVFWKDAINGALARMGFQDVISIFLRVEA